jgi:hypothetical protein
MQTVRDDVASVLASFCANLADRQVRHWRCPFSNAAILAQTEAGLDATWGEVFMSSYKRLAVGVTANLATPILQRRRREGSEQGLAWEVDVSGRRSAWPLPFGRPDTVRPGHGGRALAKMTLHKPSTQSTMFRCPKCSGQRTPTRATNRP